MPCNWADATSENLEGETGPSKGRYNDVSAWAVLGLAARYALALKLHHETKATSDMAPPSIMTYDQTARLRTLCNLSTCDFNLMLSSGLPVSIDPGNIARNISNFASQANSQHPGDLRYTALIELVSLTYQALKGSGDLSGRKLTQRSLSILNSDFDGWEELWVSRLKRTPFQHTQLPFTSVRWYRLALNSASVNAHLRNQDIDPSQPQQALLQPLKTSITAAAQMILCHGRNASAFIWGFQSQEPSSFPQGSLQTDPEALKRLLCAVDSIWISYTFAITFLVLCYFKKIIDGMFPAPKKSLSSNMSQTTSNSAEPTPLSHQVCTTQCVQDQTQCSRASCALPSTHPTKSANHLGSVPARTSKRSSRLQHRLLEYQIRATAIVGGRRNMFRCSPSWI